jgi:predicted aldo/keto reductase-like oxidoreductase
MSFVGNWTKRAEKQPYCAGERSQHTCDRAPGERSPTPVNVRWVNDRPYVRTCALGLHLTWQAQWTM